VEPSRLDRTVQRVGAEAAQRLVVAALIVAEPTTRVPSYSTTD
jgi:hypothetical protein